jgi:hypothetical protein
VSDGKINMPLVNRQTNERHKKREKILSTDLILIIREFIRPKIEEIHIFASEEQKNLFAAIKN